MDESCCSHHQGCLRVIPNTDCIIHDTYLLTRGSTGRHARVFLKNSSGNIEHSWLFGYILPTPTVSSLHIAERGTPASLNRPSPAALAIRHAAVSTVNVFFEAVLNHRAGRQRQSILSGRNGCSVSIRFVRNICSYSVFIDLGSTWPTFKGILAEASGRLGTLYRAKSELWSHRL